MMNPRKQKKQRPGKVQGLDPGSPDAQPRARVVWICTQVWPLFVEPKP